MIYTSKVYQFIDQYNQLVKRAADERSDWINPICIIALSVIGVFFIYSSQSYSGGSQWKMQIIWIIVGFITYVGVSTVNYKIFLQNANYFYGACIFLLIPLAIKSVFNIDDIPLLTTRHGSSRWIDLGAFSLQPSEPAKIATMALIASILARSEVGNLKDSLMTLLKVGIVFFIPFLLIFLEPDLGSCLVFLPMVFSLLYVSNLSKRFFATVFALFVVLMALLTWDICTYNNFLKENKISASESQSKNAFGSQSWFPLRDYQRNRILSFIAPDVVDPRGITVSWNRNQSLIAAGSGGLWGKGHNEGTQAKLGYLPKSVASNDFILSVILEEKGFIGGLSIIALYSILVINNLRIAGLSRDRFGMLIATGVSVIFMTHILINIGMTIGIMPITGLPLPFVSYGGSFIIVCCILQGLTQSVYRFRREFS